VAPPPPILEADRVSLRFGGVRALTDVSFAVPQGEIFSIIGPNGAGKTSMVNCISGRYRPTGARPPQPKTAHRYAERQRALSPIWKQVWPYQQPPVSAKYRQNFLK